MRVVAYIALIFGAMLCVASASAQQSGPRLTPIYPVYRYTPPPLPPPVEDRSFKPPATLPNGIWGEFGGRSEPYGFGSDAIGVSYPPFPTVGMQTKAWVCNWRGAPLAFRWDRQGLAAAQAAQVEQGLCTVSVRSSTANDFTVLRTPVPSFLDEANVLRARYRTENPDAPRRAAGTAPWTSFLAGGAQLKVGEATHRLRIRIDLAVSDAADRLTVTVDRVPSDYSVALAGLDRLIGDSALLGALNPETPVAILPLGETMDAASHAWLLPEWRDRRVVHVPATPGKPQAVFMIPLAPERARSLKADKDLFFVTDPSRAIHAVAPYTLVAP